MEFQSWIFIYSAFFLKFFFVINCLTCNNIKQNNAK